MELKIYSSDGRLRCAVEPGNNSTQVEEIQAGNVLTLNFTLPERVMLEVNDYTEFLGGRYWLTEKYRPVQKSTVEWEYSVRFLGLENLITRFLVLNTTDGGSEPVFTLTAPAREHVALIVRSINTGFGNTDWKVGAVESGDNIVVDYQGKYCHEALKEVADKIGTEYWIEGTTVNLCRCEHGESVTLGYQKGLTKIQPDTADNAKVYTRLFPIGSSINIDKSKYGYGRLQLPGKAQYVDINTDKYGIIHHYEENAFAGIFPRRTGTVSDVRSGEFTGEDGNPFTVYYFKDPGMTFDPNDHEIGGLVKRVSFQEGSELAGLGSEEDGNYFFECNFDSDTKEFEIITQFNDAGQLPGGVLVPKNGDRYILWNIRMPDEYYSLAEAEFLDAVNEYNRKHALDVSCYKASTDYIDIEKRGLDLHVGRRIRLESDEYFPETGYKDSRITKITRKVNLPTQMDLEISDALSTGAMDKIKGNIEDVKSYVLQNKGDLPDIIRTGDRTVPTDNNILSAKKTLTECLSKKKDDRSLGKISSDIGFEIGRFESGSSGGMFGIDPKTGQSYQEVDKLFVRVKAYFEELTTVKSESIAGKKYITPGGSVKCLKVEETRDAYRCWFLSEQDGEKTDTFIRIGDQAISQVFNAASLLNNKIHNHRYWRLVIAVENDAEVDSAGNHYGYIELSKSDCEDGSDIPSEGDIIEQFGNRTDPDRQSAIVLSTVDSDAPCIKLYQGISTYSLIGCDMMGFGYNPVTGKVFLNSYGDFHFGDRTKEGSYIEFNEANKEIIAKLKLSLESTIGDKSVEDFVEEIEGYDYIKEALVEDSYLEGGLFLTSTIRLGTNNKGVLEQNVNAGINGIMNPSAIGGGIAAWYGGDMIDMADYYDWDDASRKWVVKPDTSVEGLRIAQGIDRMDGTGYRAGGSIWWDASGNVHADPLSFFVGEESVGNVLGLFRFHPYNNSPFDTVTAVTPQRQFTALRIGSEDGSEGITISYDAGNKALKVDGNLYSMGDLAAFGKGAAMGGSGGAGGSGGEGVAGLYYGDWTDYVTDYDTFAVSGKSGKALYDLVAGMRPGLEPSQIGRLTLTRNGVEAGVFSPGVGSSTIDIAVPSRVSELQNDAAYITSAALSPYAKTSELPKSLRNPHALTFGSKSYDGSAAVTLTAADLGAVTSLAGYATQSWVEGKGYLTSAAADQRYITSLGTSGDHLTWTRNGTTSNITVPYATNADTVDGVHNGEVTARYFNPRSFTNASEIDSAASVWTSNGHVPDNGIFSYRSGITIGSGFARAWQLWGGRNDTTIYFRKSKSDMSGWDDDNIKQIAFTSDIPTSMAWSAITGKPSTLGGYGITDAYTKAEVDNTLSAYLPLSGGTLTGGLTAPSVTATSPMTISAGLPSDLKVAARSRLYSNGLAMTSPGLYNDAGWIRMTGTTENDSVLEIAVGDDGNMAAGAATREEIVVRGYGTTGNVHAEIKLLDKGGNQTFNAVTASSLTIGAVTITYDTAAGALRIGGNAYATGDLAALGASSVSGGTSGTGGGTACDRLDSWGDYTSDKAGHVLSAALGWDLNTRVTANATAIALRYTKAEVDGIIAGLPKTSVNPYALTLAAGAFSAQTYDGSAAKTVNIPTHTSHLTNNSGFLTAHQSLADYYTKAETAQNFVRALYGQGTLSGDMNEMLSNTAFIGSINATRNMPGSAGWYNVIQLPHRNGASDGPGYVGQIALGMTTSYDSMFFRTHRTGAWQRVARYSDIPTTLPASDVAAWAKAATKPSYAWGEITGKPNLVTLDTEQTISGHKTFTSPLDVTPNVQINGTNNGFANLPYLRLHIPNVNWAMFKMDAAGMTHLLNGGATDFNSYANIKAASFIKAGGTSSQFLKADGSVDSNSYALSSALGGYMPLSGGRMTGALNFANGTWNVVGDDAAMGDCNLAGCIGIKGLNGAPGIAFYDSSNNHINNLIAHTNGNLLWKGFDLWHSGNDGAGSGLDADLLDGYHISNLHTRGWTSLTTYTYDSTNGIRFYSHKLFNLSNLDTIIRIRVTTDINYPSYSEWVLRVNQTGDYGKCVTLTPTAVNTNTLYVFIDSSYGVWVQCDARWSSTFNYRVERGTSPTVISSVIGNPSDILQTITNCGNSRDGSSYSNLSFQANAKSATRLATTSEYTAWGQTFFTNGVPQSISGNMTGVGSITASGEAVIAGQVHINRCGIGFNRNVTNGNIFNSAENGAQINYSTTYNGLEFGTRIGSAYNVRMLIATSGNVGIGTTSPGYKLDVNGDIIAGNNSWLRTRGHAGWYSETHGGGWYMTDGVWMRVYNNKNIYQGTGIIRTDGELQVGDGGSKFRADAAGNVTCAGRLTIGTVTLECENGALKVNGSVVATGDVVALAS